MNDLTVFYFRELKRAIIVEKLKKTEAGKHLPHYTGFPKIRYGSAYSVWRSKLFLGESITYLPMVKVTMCRQVRDKNIL